MHTSQQWWSETKRSPERLSAWLLDQHRGEATAAGRIRTLRDTFAEPDSHAWRVLSVIAAQEEVHAAWVAQLLEARGLRPGPLDVPTRYWEAPLAAITDLQTGCGVGAWAEAMRLERITCIVDDEEAPADVRAVFRRILPQERFHEAAFRALAGPGGLAASRSAHLEGRNALGLTP